MRAFVFSDVHGNLPALELALQDAKKTGPIESYICLGDVIDYGPWSNECVDLVTSLPNLVYIEGNHEADFLQGSHTGDNAVANAFFDFCLPRFDRFEKIKHLPKTYELNGFTFQHTILGKNIYPDTELTLDHNYVVGHSHHQFWLEQPPFRLYNPGSIGQNRKYLNVINYMILETEGMHFELRALKYDPSVILDEMRRRGYPAICLDYYASKERYEGTPQPPTVPSTIL